MALLNCALRGQMVATGVEIVGPVDGECSHGGAKWGINL